MFTTKVLFKITTCLWHLFHVNINCYTCFGYILYHAVKHQTFVTISCIMFINLIFILFCFKYSRHLHYSVFPSSFLVHFYEMKYISDPTFICIQCTCMYCILHFELAVSYQKRYHTNKFSIASYQNPNYCTALHCTTLHCTAALHCTALHCTALHYTTLHYTTLHYTALHRTAPHRTALHCTALHCTALHFCIVIVLISPCYVIVLLFV